MNKLNRYSSLRSKCYSLVILLMITLSNITFGFIVQDIRVIGLKKILKSTVLDSIDDVIKINERYETSMSKAVIKELYRTEFFDEISVSRSGKKLIIRVKERPTIANIRIIGQKIIPKDQIKTILRNLGLYKGEMFDTSSLEKINQFLKSAYVSRGKYGAKIDTKIKALSQNRVDITVKIDEGAANVVNDIRFIGNHSIRSIILIDKMALSTSGFTTIFSDKDKYTKEKLDASLVAINNYYKDKGFINFKVTSSQVTIIPGTAKVIITIKVSEGDIFRIKGYSFSGNMIVPRATLESKVKIKPGEVFSQAKVLQTVNGINNLLSDQGYTYSTVDIQPNVNKKTKEVFINFFVKPGRPIYVRHIIFSGNHKTADYVLRRAFRQLEGSRLSISKVQESLRQLRLLTYITNAQLEQQQVPGVNNQVDLHIPVTEGQIAEIKASAGYGTLGIEFRAGVNNYNLFGTGNSGGINFKRDAWGDSYSINYFNPYYTDSGIGRGFDLYYHNHKPGKNFGSINKLKVSPFTSDKFGGAMNYIVPISDTHSLNFGLGYEYLEIKRISKSGTPSTQLQAFIDTSGKKFHNVRLTAGWQKSSYDQLPFPTSGSKHVIDGLLAIPIMQKGLPLSKGGSPYYKVGYTGKFYQPLIKGFIFNLFGGVKFGNSFGKSSVLPFYENYYAGGLGMQGQVRGFRSASLGPRDSLNVPLGGNLLVQASAGLILPAPFSGETIRTTIFFDAGNVYQTAGANPLNGVVNSYKIRYSVGVGFEWRTPIGPINFSVAFALNKAKGDNIEIPGFSIYHGF